MLPEPRLAQLALPENAGLNRVIFARRRWRRRQRIAGRARVPANDYDSDVDSRRSRLEANELSVCDHAYVRERSTCRARTGDA